VFSNISHYDDGNDGNDDISDSNYLSPVDYEIHRYCDIDIAFPINEISFGIRDAIPIKLDVKSNVIINSVQLMVEGLEMDVQRTEGDGIFSESEMSTYINKMSKSFFDVTASFILPEGKYPYQDVIVTTASTKIWMIRDLLQDFESGYVNITREKLAQYNLISKNLPQNKNLKNYLESEINNIIRLLIDEAKIMKQFPIRLKLFNYYTQVYYLPKVFRVKAYGNNLLKVQNRKKLYNETVTYFLTFKLALKILFTEFYLYNSVK